MRRNARFLSISLVLLAVQAASLGITAAAPPECPIRLVDATAESAIAFQHVHGGNGQQYIVEFMVAGIATFDFDGDGLMDIYFLNGTPLKGAKMEPKPRNALYRNMGNGVFTDVTEHAGVGDLRHALGVAAGDYDNDGDPDLYVSNFGPNVLYRNNGDGTFNDVTERAGVASGSKFGAGACFLDMDGDGDLDLYAANYIEFSYERHATLIVDSFPYPPGPGDYPPEPDTLFRNNGDGTFTDVSRMSGVGSVTGPSMGAVCGDYDNDGDTDIFVCNDGVSNYLFQNDGRGTFEETGILSCVAFNLHGSDNGSMGADCGDYDNDGLLDLFMTDYTAEMPVLYRNVGDGIFEDATSLARAGSLVFPHTNWGSGLVDFDNDGDRDLFIACGHFLDNIRDIDDRTAYHVRNHLLINERGRFEDVSTSCGDGLDVVESSRGASFDDLDNDGDVDGVVLNANSRPTVLRNESMNRNHWLQVRFRAVKSNREGVGARVRVIAGDIVQVAEVHSGRGYQSHFGSRLQFGLRQQDRVQRIEVQWIGGGRDVFTDLDVDRSVTLIEGTGRGD